MGVGRLCGLFEMIGKRIRDRSENYCVCELRINGLVNVPENFALGECRFIIWICLKFSYICVLYGSVRLCVVVGLICSGRGGKWKGGARGEGFVIVKS